jgi:preprotein translocase subunit SecY
MNNKLWQSLANSWKIPELRKKLLFTAAMIAIYRFGSHVPVPGVNIQALSNFFNSGAGGVVGFLNLFSGGALGRVAVFALGIMPYITASIIMQLLTVVIPKLEELQKEGEQGQKIITQYSRYLTVGLAAVQSIGYIFLFRTYHALPNLTVTRFALILFTLTAGATVVMWIGELITARGIGNGMSILIFISIISRLPGGIQKFFQGSMSLVSQVGFVIIALAVVVGVIWITSGERRIPVQYAKRIVGRRMMGGTSTFIPLKVNMAGVIPIIFASSVMLIPPTIAQFLPGGQTSWFSRAFGPSSVPYIIGEALLIILFTYFYTAVTFNPIDQADNLKKYGGFVPGVRPGRPTAEFLDRILTRLTLPGALFLAALAVLPWLLYRFLSVPFNFGGTSVLIVVGVALDTMRQMEAQLLMRHYEGFLK